MKSKVLLRAGYQANWSVMKLTLPALFDCLEESFFYENKFISKGSTCKQKPVALLLTKTLKNKTLKNKTKKLLLIKQIKTELMYKKA